MQFIGEVTDKLAYITEMLKKNVIPTKQVTKQTVIQPTKQQAIQSTKKAVSQPNEPTKKIASSKEKLAKLGAASLTKPSDKPTDHSMNSVEIDDRPEDMHDSISSKPLEASIIPESPVTYDQASGGKEKIFMDVKNWTFQDKLKVQFSGDMNSSVVTGCCFMPSGELVICDNSNQLVKSFANIQSSVLLPAAPFDIAAIDKKNAVVTLPEQKELQLIKVIPIIQKGGTIAVGNKCWGVDVADDLIFVTCYTTGKTGKEDGEVRVYTTIGNMVKSFFIYGLGSHNLKRLDYIGVSRSGDKIFVSDSKTNTVMCVTADKKVVFEFQDPELLCPKGLFVDGNDNVIVCGKVSKNIHVITTGAYQHKVLTDTMHFKPISVSIKPSDGKLVVGLFKDKEMLCFTLV